MKSKFIFSIFLLLLLPAISFSDLRITVEQNAGWGEAQTSNIKALCENVALHFQEQLRDEHKINGKLKIVHHPGNPIVFYKTHTDVGYDYQIGLSTSGTVWDQFSYQFGHEFTHVLHNFEDTKWQTKTQWFEEALAELGTLWVIRSMSKTWAYRAPYQNWINYRHALKNYADGLMNSPGTQYAGSGSDWLEEWEDRMRREEPGVFRYDRVAQLTYKFLPLFEEHPEAWNAVRQMPASDKKMSEYMKEWYQDVDPQDKRFVEAIANIMGIRVKDQEIPTSNITRLYANLTFTHEGTDAIRPINPAREWDGWTQGIWEKTPAGTTTSKPNYLDFSEMEALENWMYSHAPSIINYDISGGHFTSFGAYFILPNFSCGGGASMEFTAFADTVKVYSQMMRIADTGTYIEFDIPPGTRIFGLSVGDLGNNGCDHFVLGEPRVYTEDSVGKSVVQGDIDADVNNDGYVDLSDVMIVRSAIQNSVSYHTDVNNDGKTDEVDVLIVKAKAVEAIAAAAPSLIQKRKMKLTTWGSLKKR